MRVAIVQNQVGIDGRSRVIGEIVIALNEMGVTPDVYTLSTEDRRRSWLEVLMAGRRPRCEFPPTWRLPLFRGHVYQAIAHNRLVRTALNRYDVVVNSNDFVGFLPTTARHVHYFHFPLRATFATTARYRRRGLRLLVSPAREAAERFDGEIRPEDVVLANSCFTAERIRQLWPSARTEVLHPPVDRPLTPPRLERDVDVVTLGNIAADKHQFEQVELAAAMPQRRFAIIGAVKSAAYYRRVKKAIRSGRVGNVTLVVDASPRQVSDYLARSRVFLHMKEAEHFGIGVAQALVHGCVPVVHDSGGQVELVTDPALRYRSRGEIPRILEEVLAGRLPEPERAREMRALADDLAPERFRARFTAALRPALASGATKNGAGGAGP
jgi:glycosyltransferase involved in cell wall biosynthesis